MTAVCAETVPSVNVLMAMKYILLYVSLLDTLNCGYELCNKVHLKCNGINRMKYNSEG